MKNFISFLTFFLLFSISQDILSSKRVVIENVMVIDAINPVRKEMTVIMYLITEKLKQIIELNYSENIL